MFDESKKAAVLRDISRVLNYHSIDNDLATPDFLLAEHVVAGLESYGKTVFSRAAWFKRVEPEVSKSLAEHFTAQEASESSTYHEDRHIDKDR